MEERNGQQNAVAVGKIIYRYDYKGRASMTANGRTFVPGQSCHAHPGTDFDKWLRENKAFSGPTIVVAGGEKAASEALHAAEIDRKRRDIREAELAKQAEQERAARAKDKQDNAEQQARLQAEIEALKAKIAAAGDQPGTSKGRRGAKQEKGEGGGAQA